MEFEHYIEVFRFHIALVCLYFTIVLKYDVHLIWEFSGKLWLSWTVCVGSRVGSVNQETGREEKLGSLSMMIDLTNVSNIILELGVGKWYQQCCVLHQCTVCRVLSEEFQMMTAWFSSLSVALWKTSYLLKLYNSWTVLFKILLQW